MTPEQLTDKVAQEIFDAAPFRDEAGPFEVQSRQHQDITRLYARAAIRVVLEEAERQLTDAAREAITRKSKSASSEYSKGHGEAVSDVGLVARYKFRTLMPKERETYRAMIEAGKVG
jgi:hypothetical protein